MVSSICFSPYESQEVLVTAPYLTEQGNDDLLNSSVDESAIEEEQFQALEDQLHASAVENREGGCKEEKDLHWMDSSNELAGIHFVRMSSKLMKTVNSARTYT